MRVKSSARPQLVTLVGVPGIGKSRLVAELFQASRTSPELITWRQGRSLPYGEGVTYWALGEMVKAQAGILETETAEGRSEAARRGRAAVRRRPGRRLGRADSCARSLASRRPRRRPDDRRQEAYCGLAALLRGARRAGARWCSSSRISTGRTTGCSISSTTRRLGRATSLCRASARRGPSCFDRRPDWGGGKTTRRRLARAAVGRGDRTSSLMALLDRAVLPAEQQPALLRARRRQPALRRAVRAHARRARSIGRATGTRDHPGHHRGTAGPSRAAGEGPPPGRRRRRQGLLVGRR